MHLHCLLLIYLFIYLIIYLFCKYHFFVLNYGTFQVEIWCQSPKQTEPKTQSEGGDKDSMQNKMGGTDDGDPWWGPMCNCNNDDDDDDDDDNDDLISKMTRHVT